MRRREARTAPEPGARPLPACGPGRLRRAGAVCATIADRHLRIESVLKILLSIWLAVLLTSCATQQGASEQCTPQFPPGPCANGK